MLTIHFANRYERLAGLLVERLGARTQPSVFAPDQVIVPSVAVRRQLTLTIAQRQGICANVRFDYLAQWLWSLIARVVPGVQAESPFAPGVLAWRIFAAFDEQAWITPHPRLRDYLAHADAVMRYELATQLAELFDQYITFRPDWLAAWAEARTLAIAAGDTGAAADQAWQAALWQRLGAEAGAEHPATAFARVLESHGAALVAQGHLPAEVHVFVLPSLAPLHLGLLQTLSGCADVHVYALNPCREYWLEVVDHRRLAYLATRNVPGRELHHEVGNRLLAAWGAQTKAQLGLLISAAGDAVIDEAHFDEPEGTSLLAQLQHSILDMEELAPGSITLAPDDRSIEVHVCHSLAREFEVLHDRLLALFAAPNRLHAPQLSDILVVTPDLEAAAPLIDAIFGTAPADRRIAYQITGRARSHVNASARILLEALALVGSRFTASSVFSLLQQPLVAHRFALASDDLDRIHAWLTDAGVHWALDADHRASFGVPAQSRHSFADGLGRLYLGYALPTKIDAPFDGMLPAGDVEGTDGIALGALWRFVDALAVLRHELSAPQPATAWPALLADVLQRFSAPGDEEALQDEREVLTTIASLADELRQGAPEQPLTLDVVRHALARALDDSARGGMPGGAVTFASMASLRHLPYATICAIGLNDGAFPSRSRPAEFDLIAHAPRAGDRQRRTDERNLFLDLLLAARENFYMSYTGRSVRDNAPLPPSTLVSELLDTLLPAIAGDTKDARARLVIEHPLQAFSEEAFRLTADPRLRSFDCETAQALRERAGSRTTAQATATLTARTDTPEGAPETVPETAPAATAATLRASSSDIALDEDDDSAGVESAQPFFVVPLPTPGDEWCDLPIERLITFFANPSRFLLRQRLGIALARADDELEDDEPFLPSVPVRSALAARLLPPLLAGASFDAARKMALAGTEMPAGAIGLGALERELATLQHFALELGELTHPAVLAPHEASVELTLAGRPWRLRAAFADLRAGGLVRYRYDEPRARDFLAAWLQHLMLCADPPQGVARRTIWQARSERFTLEPCTDPQTVLHDLLALFERGLREPLPFFPKTAWAYMLNDQSTYLAQAAWKVTPHTPYGESADAAYRLALRGRPDPLGPEGWPDFHDCAVAVFAPMLECLVGAEAT